MEASRPRSVSSRLKHAAIFVATVWALAASFVAFELLGLAFTSVMVANPEQGGDLLVSAATLQSSACRVTVDEAAGQAGVLGQGEAKADAWMLGVHFGSDTQSAAQRAPGGSFQADGEVARLASELAVPAPPSFFARQIAHAHDEFVTHVEADAGGTAHRLAVIYSPQACELFKLGAFWGYTMRIRVTLPGQSTVMSIPINYYARQVGLPEPLTRAMITPAAAGGSRVDRVAQTIALTEAVTKHLKGEQ
jgi:hypothetical protein